VEILRGSGNKSRSGGAQPAVREGETDFLYCPSALATRTTKTTTVTIEEGSEHENCIRNASKNDLFRHGVRRATFSRALADALHERVPKSAARMIALKAETSDAHLREEENAARGSSFLPRTRRGAHRRRHRRLFPRGTSAPQGTDAGNITSSGPFYGYYYAASVPYIHATYLCELLYTRTHTRTPVTYIRATPARHGPWSLLLPSSVACREFQGVMFHSRSLSSVSEPFTSTLGQGVEIFIRHNEICSVPAV